MRWIFMDLETDINDKIRYNSRFQILLKSKSNELQKKIKKVHPQHLNS